MGLDRREGSSSVYPVRKEAERGGGCTPFISKSRHGNEIRIRTGKCTSWGRMQDSYRKGSATPGTRKSESYDREQRAKEGRSYTENNKFFKGKKNKEAARGE